MCFFHFIMSLQASRLFFQCLLNSLIHSDLSPDALSSEFMIGTGLRQGKLSVTDWPPDPSTCSWPALLYSGILSTPAKEQPYGWVGTGSTSASETAKTKSQQEQTLQGLKLTNSRNFHWACANWNIFKPGFPEKQYCWCKSNSSAKGPIQKGDSHKHSQIAASMGQTMCIFFLQSHTHCSGFWSTHIENKTLASYGKCGLTASQILYSLKSS